MKKNFIRAPVSNVIGINLSWFTMRILFFIPLLIHFIYSIGFAGPLINEVSSGGSSDWVEITLSDETESFDISQCFVTMYYGSNEKISESPVTLRNRNIRETPYDDRFAVVHFTAIPFEDETDSTGDTNNNGILDLYCCNYGLWNTDSVVAIDSDDTPTNGGIIDFIAFSNRDGSINSTIGGYIEAAIIAGQWELCSSSNIQDCAVGIGDNGLNSYSTISRIRAADTNSLNDFVITPYATPGRENITDSDRVSKKLFSVTSKKTTHIYGSGNIPLTVFIYEFCSIKLRIFNSTGFTIYSSELREDLNPGSCTFYVPENRLRGKILTGLYPVKIEAAGRGSSSETSVLFLVIIRKR